MRTVLFILLGIAIGAVAALLFRSHRPAAPSQAATGDTLAEWELNRIVPAIDIDGLPFERAIEEIQKLTSAQITVDWAVLKSEGFDRKAPITLHGTGIYLWQVLDRLTINGSRAIRRKDHPMDYQPRDGRIAISIASQLGRKVTARLYDVHDLIPAAPRTIGTVGPVPSTPIGQLKTLIQDTINVESWIDYGGKVGTIYEVAGRLYIVQDWPAHRQIQEFLHDLRAVEGTSPPTVVEKQWSDVNETWIAPDLPETLDAMLRRPIDRIELNRTPFDQAIEGLQKMSGVIISVNWTALAAINISRTTPVSVRARDVPLPSVLDLLIAESFPGAAVSFTVEDGVVEISTREEMAVSTLTRIYDVRDLLRQAKPAEREDLMVKLMKAISDTVAPDSWRDSGGTVGSMREFQSRLIITQTWSNHERVAGLLDGLRKTGRGLGPTTHDK